jgi:hypothetical protein
MGDTGERDWVRTLDEVGQAIEGCLAALDRYEVKFSAMLAEQLPPREGAPRFDRSLPEGDGDDGWTGRLAAAKAGADEVERLLDEQEVVWGRWREALSAWRRLVEQPPASEPGG